MKLNHRTLGLLALSAVFLSSCGAQGEEQLCHQGACTEKSINAPLSEEDSSLAGFSPWDETQESLPQSHEELEEQAALRGGYAMPEFQQRWGLRKELYDAAVAFYEENQSLISNNRYVTIIDMKLHSRERRFYLFDLAKGRVERHNTSHGQGSDRDNNGYAEEFSNTVDSHMTSLGFYLTLGTYRGSNGYSMRLRGLEGTNSNAEKRAIVVHPASYVSNSRAKAGRSWGCPALDPRVSRSVINRIKGGSLLFIGS